MFISPEEYRNCRPWHLRTWSAAVVRIRHDAGAIPYHILPLR
jgi:hypothetical protein